MQTHAQGMAVRWIYQGKLVEILGLFLRVFEGALSRKSLIMSVQYGVAKFSQVILKSVGTRQLPCNIFAYIIVLISRVQWPSNGDSITYIRIVPFKC